MTAPKKPETPKIETDVADSRIIKANLAANKAQAALQFLQRCTLQGGETDAFLQVRSFLVELANGGYDMVPTSTTRK